LYELLHPDFSNRSFTTHGIQFSQSQDPLIHHHNPKAMRNNYSLSFLIAIFPAFALVGQDSLTFKNNDFVAGEIKSMDRGVLTIETDYSKVILTLNGAE
jgi:hypothetical protein